MQFMYVLSAKTFLKSCFRAHFCYTLFNQLLIYFVQASFNRIAVTSAYLQ